MLTLFDDLFDLSCADTLWSFNNLNTRLTALLYERVFYRPVNLSSTRYHRFKTL